MGESSVLSESLGLEQIFNYLCFVSQGDEAVEFSVNVRILGDEKRFGFSVMGGVDEGFPPRIDEISKGEFIQYMDPFRLVVLIYLRVSVTRITKNKQIYHQ